MRYRIVAVGRLRRGFYAEGCRYYLGRLATFAQVELAEVKEGKGNDADRKVQAEGEALLAQGRGRIITLDERGKQQRSGEMAGRLSDLELAGDSSITLLVGGAEGFSKQVRGESHESWSLSPLTLPHELARLLLLEQLYRAETIRAGHPYHRE